ncbi:MAG: quinone-dependent dihydroorotate dehydrogenase [Methyloligellaceae bacterium]
MYLTLFDIAPRMLRLLPPEAAHELTLQLLEKGIYLSQKQPEDPKLAQTIFGMRFPNPLGMAAGFDKDGRVPNQVLDLGFGFTEVGTVTPHPQDGNPKPRLFRLTQDEAILNRMGFNNAGFTALKDRLDNLERKGVVGINIGANKNSQNPNEDYIEGLQFFSNLADYFTINISSPNTPGLRDLQTPERLHELLSWFMQTRSAMMSGGHPWRPIFVKLAPDLLDHELPVIVDCLVENAVDGIIISNTTISRDGVQEGGLAGQAGGISGAPLFEIATHMLAKVYCLTKGRIPLIGVGGIDSGEAAVAKLEAGASLLQIYTGLVYKGPGLVRKIKRYLIDYMEENGLNTISEITGSNAELWVKDPQEAMEQ